MTNSYSPYNVPAKPGMVQAIGIMPIVSGILNIIWALTFTALIVIGTIGIGLLCAPVTILPLVLGIFEIIYGTQILANPPKVRQPNLAIPILEICTVITFNVLSTAVGIVSLIFYNDDTVKGYFAQVKPAP